MPSPPTPEQAAALLHERPLNSPILEVFLNGFYTCLVIVSIAAVWTTPRKNNRKKLWTTFILLLYICATIHASISWEFLVVAFQNHGTSPDVLNALTHPNLKLKILALVASFLSFLLADVIMVWRCWIVWGRSWIVIVFPILAAVAGTVCAGLGLAGQIAVASIQNSSSATRLAPLVQFSTPFLSLSLVVTLYTTGLIAWRILHVQRHAKKHEINHEVRSDFSPVLEIVVESSALYAASLFVFVVLLAMKSENQNYPQNIHAQIAGIAPTLLILRVSAGRARKDEEWTTPVPVSGLEFACPTETSQSAMPVSIPGHSMAGPPNTEERHESVFGGYTTGTSSNSMDRVNQGDIGCPES
ncbi:hypothetical protein FB451DRAFT_1235113 [Mycena latifolia]|nr:hypothetical protein FB451DRAFT_1235113 [Mycena latifolia]